MLSEFDERKAGQLTKVIGNSQLQLESCAQANTHTLKRTRSAQTKCQVAPEKADAVVRDAIAAEADPAGSRRRRTESDRVGAAKAKPQRRWSVNTDNRITQLAFLGVSDTVLDACAEVHHGDREAEVMKAVKQRKLDRPDLLGAHLVAPEDIEGGYVDSRAPPGAAK